MARIINIFNPPIELHLTHLTQPHRELFSTFPTDYKSFWVVFPWSHFARAGVGLWLVPYRLGFFVCLFGTPRMI